MFYYLGRCFPPPCLCCAFPQMRCLKILSAISNFGGRRWRDRKKRSQKETKCGITLKQTEAKTKQSQRFTIARPQCSVLEPLNRKHPLHALSLFKMLLFPSQKTNFYLIVITESGMQHVQGNTFSLTSQSNDVEKNKYLFSNFRQRDVWIKLHHKQQNVSLKKITIAFYWDFLFHILIY